MERNQATKKVVDLLLGDNEQNNDFYASLFENYNYGDPEMTPISPLYMDNVNSNHNIVITEEAYKELQKIRDITRETNREVAYLIFGEEKPNGVVWLDTVISDYIPASTTAAIFTNIDDILNKYVESIQKGDFNNGNKQIVCHGHTHGRTQVSDNYSFGDLISYVQLANAHPLFQKKQVETMAMLMPPCGDFNFIMYDNNQNCEGFYTFPAVYMRKNNSNAIPLPAYTNGNYILNNVLKR